MNDSRKVNDEVRREVARAYTHAVKKEGPKTGCCSAPPPTENQLANLAGYTTAELNSLPPDAAVNAFGCGNPVAFGEIKEGDVVLDLGSGAGIDLLLAAKKVGPGGKVIGVDMTDEMIARAEKNIKEAGLSNVEVRKGIIEALPVEDNSVDWVISNCVINLSPEKHRVFAEIARVLKPGGRMLVSDIVAQDLPDWVIKNVTLYSSCIAGAIDEEAYLSGLRDAGLEAVEVRDRLTYDADQLGALAGTELENQALGCCGGAVMDNEMVKRALELLAGKIASAKSFGRKPVPA